MHRPFPADENLRASRDQEKRVALCRTLSSADAVLPAWLLRDPTCM